ncbi:MAG TPA: hypothetical protein GX708_07125 [Gallicola sp.]|nr:hypothetical protein [Gallicola sp.]
MYEVNKYYIYFAAFNVLLIYLSILLQSIGLIKPFTNDVSSMYPALLGNNVETGQVYYMPGWISLQQNTIRIFDFIPFGLLLGWTHEPHVLSFLVIPSAFLILAKQNNPNRWSILYLILCGLAFIFAFSVTSTLVLFVSFILFLMVSKPKQKITLGIIFLIFIIIFTVTNLNFSLFYDYIKLKTFENTSSLDYSVNNISKIIFPNSIFGNGVLLLKSKNDTQVDAGILSAFFYILLYVSLIIKSLKLIFKYKQKYLYYGLALIYFILHGLKLSSAVLAYPYMYYFMIILSIIDYDLCSKQLVSNK